MAASFLHIHILLIGFVEEGAQTREMVGPAPESGEGEGEGEGGEPASAEQAALGDGAARERVRRGEKRELGEGGMEKQRGTGALLCSRSFRWQKGQGLAVKAVRAVTGPANRMA